jgi:ribonuclease Z
LLEHAIPSYGYRIVEKDKPGMLLVDKLKGIGVPPGPQYQLLKNGETIELEDGRRINGKEFLGPDKKGRVVAILGDSRPCENAVELAKEADLLIHEATLDKSLEKTAHEFFHSTTHQAAQIAKKAQVKKLIITHISSRYEKQEWVRLEQEAKEIFSNTIIAEDFKKVTIKT